MDAPKTNNKMAMISTTTIAPKYEDTLEILPPNRNLADAYNIGAKITKTKIAMKNEADDSGVNCTSDTPKI